MNNDNLPTMNNWHEHAADGGWHVVLMIGLIGLLVLLIALAVMAIQHFRNTKTKPGTSSEPIAILKTRLARGEISEEDYTSRLALLSND